MRTYKKVLLIIAASLIGIGILVGVFFMGKGNSSKDTDTTTASTSQNATPVTSQNTTNPVTPTQTLNLKETLIGTLDDFGVKTTRTVNCALGGQILDQSLNEGEIIVGNAYAIHDNGYVSQKGNNVFYVIAPPGGIRVRATVFDGVFFIIDANKMTLNQAIAAMRDTLIRAHGATFETIQFHELTRYGDPVK